MRSSFFVHEYWMNPGKKQPLRILAQSKDVFLGKMSPRCMQNQLILARFVSYVSSKA